MRNAAQASAALAVTTGQEVTASIPPATHEIPEPCVTCRLCACGRPLCADAPDTPRCTSGQHFGGPCDRVCAERALSEMASSGG